MNTPIRRPGDRTSKGLRRSKGYSQLVSRRQVEVFAYSVKGVVIVARAVLELVKADVK